MEKFKASADIVEINRYDFVIEAETKEEAETKLKEYLENHCPYPYNNDENGIRCTDREPAMETRETESITIK